MKITIFGATGKSGLYILSEALNRNHQVTVFVRTPEKLGKYASSVKIVQGDVADFAKVAFAIKGADVVVSALGHVKGSKNDILTIAFKNIIKAMQETKVDRLVNLTGSGVPAKGDNPTFLDKLIVKVLEIVDPARIADGISHVKIITKSNLDWTIVRTPVQSNSKVFEYVTGKVGDRQLKMFAPRSAIAKFILDIIEQGTYKKELPVITGK